jgi:hypothetical protein
MVFGGGESEGEILGCLGSMLLVGKSKRRGGERGRGNGAAFIYEFSE